MARELLWPWSALGLSGSWGGEKGGQKPDLVSLYISSREKGWRNHRHNLRWTRFSCLILSKGPHWSTLAGRLRSNYLCPWTFNNSAFTFWPGLDWTGQALAWRQEWTQRKSSTSLRGVKTLLQSALLRTARKVDWRWKGHRKPERPANIPKATQQSKTETLLTPGAISLYRASRKWKGGFAESWKAGHLHIHRRKNTGYLELG